MTNPRASEYPSIRVHLVLGESVPEKWDGSWMYLGDDFSTLRKLRARWEGDSRRLGSAEALFEATSRMAPLCCREIGKQGSLQGDSLRWWMTDLAGKNVLVSKFLLHLAYAEMFRHEMSRFHRASPSTELLIICSDIFLLRVIRELAGNLGLATEEPLANVPAVARSYLRIAVRWLARWISGIFATMRRLVAARFTKTERHRATDHYDVLLHTCLDETCLQADGTLRDRYFPGLAGWLTKHHYRIATIPWIFSIRRSWNEAYKWLRNSSQNFLILEDFMSFGDLPAAVSTIFQSGKWIGARPDFGVINASPLLMRERLDSSSNAKLLLFALYPTAIKRWLAAGNQSKCFVDMFENMGVERPAIWAFRRNAPTTELVGYQHIGGIPASQIAYTATAGELATGIFPDRIVANSLFTSEAMLQGGFPPSMLEVGPSLRFQHLLRSSGAHFTRAPESEHLKDRLLLLLPLELGAALELVDLCLELSDELEAQQLKVIAKCHPMMSRKTIEKALGRDSWPQYWEWGDKASETYFPQTLFVLAEGSSLLDAAAAGIPFLALHRELRPALNPLSHWWSEFPCTRNYEPRLFKANLRQIVEDLRQPSEERAELATRIVEGLVAVSDRSMRVFLPSSLQDHRLSISAN